MEFINNNVISLQPYTYGYQPKLSDKVIKLNTNENPYPPSKNILKIFENFDLNLLKYYPSPVWSDLPDLIAKTYSKEYNIKLNKENIFIGNGSDEILSYIFRAFLTKKDNVLLTQYTYSLYKTLAEIYDINTYILPMEDNFNINLDYLEKFSKIKLFFLTNPNSPTGTALKCKYIENFVKTYHNILFIIDEAYADFNNENCLNLINKYTNVIIIRTLSKSFSLCGIRLGYSFTNKHLNSALMKIKDSYNINYLSLEIAKKVFKNFNYYKNNVKKIKKTRENFVIKLKKLDFEVLDSNANFVFIKHKTINAKKIYSYLYKKKIYVRYFEKPVLNEYLRISIGTDSQIKEVLNNIKSIIK